MECPSWESFAAADCLFADGKIDIVGERRNRKGSARREIIDLGGALVLPGFVDAHHPSSFRGKTMEDSSAARVARGYEQSPRPAVEFGQRWRNRVRGARAIFRQATKHAEWFVKCGTTTR